MVKKGIFIAASLAIIACGSKGNSNTNNPPPPKEEAPYPPPPQQKDEIERPEPAPIKPDPIPEPEPEPIKPNIVVSEALNMMASDELNFKISTTKKAIYSDCTKPITDDKGVTVHCTIDNAFKTIDGDFHINIKKELPNKLIFTYTGISVINKDYSEDNGLAKIDCTNKSVQKITFYKKGITPKNIELVENGCKTSGLVMVPLINKYSWFNTNEFLKGIFTEDGTLILSPYRRPDRSQIIYLEFY